MCNATTLLKECTVVAASGSKVVKPLEQAHGTIADTLKLNPIEALVDLESVEDITILCSVVTTREEVSMYIEFDSRLLPFFSLFPSIYLLMITFAHNLEER